MITVFGGELAARDRIKRLHSSNHLHRKRQRGLPTRCRKLLILQVELSRRRVMNSRDRADVVINLSQEVGLHSISKVEKEHRPSRWGNIAAPQDAGNS